MAAHPKLEFYKFKLKPKEGKDKTFRDFAIDELDASAENSNDEIFKTCFAHFIKSLEAAHAKNEKLKKTITIISDAKINPYLSHKPSPLIKRNVISGVINGGPYDKDAIVSDMADKELNSKLGKDKSILLPYYIFVYLPSDNSEGFFAIHSNSVEETVTSIFRNYISKLFTGTNFNKPSLESFCPKSFQDEFRNGAIIKNLTFSTTVIDNSLSTDPIINSLNEYNIKIEATPKAKTISISEAQKVLDFFNKKIFKKKRDEEIELDKFSNKRLTAENDVTKKTKVFEWNSKDKEFVPAVYLEGRIKLNDGTPDFDDLKKLCLNLFEDEILKEIRPDLDVTKYN
jgi:hypothetical protein